jgi:hypothetical protein
MEDTKNSQAPSRAVTTAVTPLPSAPPPAKGGVGVSDGDRATGRPGGPAGKGISAGSAFVPVVVAKGGAMVPPGSGNPTGGLAGGRAGGQGDGPEGQRARGPGEEQTSSSLPASLKPVAPPANLPVVEVEKEVVPAPAATPVVPPQTSPTAPSVPPSSVIPTAHRPPPTAPPPAPATPSEEPAASAETEAPVGDVGLPELSDEMIAYLTSKYYMDTNASEATAFKLSEEELEFLNEMDHLVLGGSLTLNEYVIALRDEFPALSKEKKDELIARLLADRFMPLGDELKPSAQEVARASNLALPTVPYFRMYTKPLTFGGAAGEVARTAGFDLTGQARERLRDLVVSRFKGIRIDSQVEEQLLRPTEFGGIGLGKEQARAAVIAINDILNRAKLMTEEEYSSWLSREHERKAEQEKPVEVAAPMSEEDAEIAAIAAKMPKPVRDTSSVLALATETILKRLSLKPGDDYLNKRLVSIISTRLRDVRSKNEVLMKLSRDAKVGGMGLERKEAERATDQIEEGYNEFHDLIMQEEKEALEKQTHDQELKIEERKKRDAEEHAKWFEEKVKSKRFAEDENREMVEKMRMVVQGMTTPLPILPIDVKEHAKEKQAFGDLVPAQTPTAPPAASAPGTPPPFAGAAVSAMGAFVTPTPTPPPTSYLPPPTSPPPGPTFKPVVKVSAETAKAAAEEPATMRPKMDDVKVVRPRLAGPVQELQDLTITSFRRLGKTPAEAATRVMQKIDLVAQESFNRRVEAIRAWQSSPLQKMYIGLVTEAFSTGTPVGQLVEKKRKAGENVPSSEELSAVVELNGKLRI